MKIDDIAKQLANKVNQEHHIKQYLEKVQRGAYNKGIKDAEAKQLILSSVSQQREMFDNFYKWLDDLTQYEYDEMSLTEKIEKYFF
jgi:hypothetical protein